MLRYIVKLSVRLAACCVIVQSLLLTVPVCILKCMAKLDVLRLLLTKPPTQVTLLLVRLVHEC